MVHDGSVIFNRTDPHRGRILSLLSEGGLLGYGFTPSDPPPEPACSPTWGELNDHTFRLVAFAEQATPLYVSELSHMLD
jgi:hypothetical protein